MSKQSIVSVPHNSFLALMFMGAFFLTGCAGTITQSQKGSLNVAICSPTLDTTKSSSVAAYCLPREADKSNQASKRNVASAQEQGKSANKTVRKAAQKKTAAKKKKESIWSFPDMRSFEMLSFP